MTPEQAARILEEEYGCTYSHSARRYECGGWTAEIDGDVLVVEAYDPHEELHTPEGLA